MPIPARKNGTKQGKNPMDNNPFTSLNPWYEGGLRFKCTSCGQCCTGAPGYVWLEETDIDRLREHLKLSRKDFLRKYCRYVSGRYSLRETKPDYDCIFLEESKCSVYHARPAQCKKFPWWIQNLKSQKDWDAAARSCEGINAKDAPLYTKDEITTLLEE